MSAYHPSLPHGAGPIMISEAFCGRFFIERHACDAQFHQNGPCHGNPTGRQARRCLSRRSFICKGLWRGGFKMSDYGIAKSECMTLARNARQTMGGLFEAKPL